MVNNKAYRGYALRTVVVTMLVLLMAGDAGAQTNISSCSTTISSPGEYVLNADLSSSATCINITSSDVILDGSGHTITGTGTFSVFTSGVFVNDLSTALTNVTVKNLNVTGNWFSGIRYNNVANGNITNNTVDLDLNNNVGSGILLESSSYNVVSYNHADSNDDQGISLYVSTNNALIGNTANSNGNYGIYLHSSSNNNTLSGNTANSNTIYGIILALSSSNILNGNNASNNRYYGIYLYSSSNNTLIGNNANSNNDYYGSFGIYLYSSSNNTLRGNTANSNNFTGIRLEFSSNNTLGGNNVSNNGNGITLASSSNNTIYNNYFNNTNNAIDGGGGINNWNITKQPGTNIVGGHNLGGNFWAFPNGTGFSQICTESGNDGICDFPYTLDSNNIDFLPLTYKPAYGANLTNISAIVQTTVAGTNATYPLRLTNNGTAGDSYNLTIDNPNNASNVTLNVSSPVFLNARATRIITLNVTNTTAGIFRVNVTARSNNDTTKFGYINTTTTVIVLAPYGVNLTSISALAQVTNAGTNATYSLRLANNGTGADSYTLAVDNPNNASTTALNITSPVFLNAGQGRIFTLNVTNTTTGIFRVNITARSTNDTTKFGYVNTTTTVTANVSSEIRGFKWNDSNGNAIRDIGEFGVENINICYAVENINSCTATNVSGNYRFMNLIPGNYTVYEILPPGRVQTYPANFSFIINLSSGQTVENINFGNRLIAPGEIRGFKWNDSNGNAIRDMGEFGVENINICISGPNSSCKATNASGNYRFMNLIPGNYTVYEILPPGRVQTYPANFSFIINLSSGQTVENINFGNRLIAPGEIRGFKWNDSNGNAIRDMGEFGVENINICIYGPNSTCTATNSSGNYRFMNLIPGLYTVYEILPPGKVQTFPALGQPHFISLNESEIKTGIDFGNANASKIRGFKWNDSNGNGIKDIGELGVENVNIQLTRIISPGNESFAGFTLTNATGSYGFENLNIGFYRVEELPTGRSQTYPANGSPHFINLSAGEVREGVNFGNQPVPPGEIRGFKWNDSNGNAIRDLGEFGVENVNICVSPSWKCTLTDSSGNYSFPNVPVGTYTVYEYLPFGYLATTPTMVSVTVNSTEVKIANFGNRLPVPPPSDVSVAQQSGIQNGVPTVFRPGLTILTIRKNLMNISSNVVAVNLTLKWSDGTIKTANMTQIDATNVWESNISSPFPPGTAQMTFKVDVAPAGPGVEDAVQIGDIIFIDPSGQIQNVCNGAPVSNATVTLFVEFPPTTGNFIASLAANQMPPDNPLTTGADGMYSWLTVPGTYKVMAEKMGYITNESPPVSVPPPVFNLNISMLPVTGCPPVPSPGNVTGRGWIVSPLPAPKGNDRATFRFEATNVNGVSSGELTFRDHVGDIRVSGNVTMLSVNKTAMTATFSGIATINRTGAYTYVVTVADNGPGEGTDTFAIALSTGYTANGTLGAGDLIVDP